MALAVNIKRTIFLKWMLCSLAWSFIGIAEEEEPQDKPLFLRADSVAFFKQHANTNLFFIYNTSASKQLKERVDDMKGLGLVPMYIGELAAGATNKPFTVVFEAPVPWCSVKDLDQWSLLTLDADGNLGGLSKLRFLFWGRPVMVLNCFTTNCFQKVKPDVLCVEFVERHDNGGFSRSMALNYRTLCTNYCLPKAYFTLSARGGIFIVRIEDDTRHVYYPNLLRFGTEDVILEEVLGVFLNTYECNDDAIQKLTVPEILNLFFYWNSKEYKGELGEDLQEVHTSKRVQNIVRKWLKHEHPWVRQAANYYLITYGDFGSTNVAHEVLSDAPAQSEK